MVMMIVTVILLVVEFFKNNNKNYLVHKCDSEYINITKSNGNGKGKFIRTECDSTKNKSNNIINILIHFYY